MPPSSSPLSFDTNFDPQTGVAVAIAPGIQRVTAPNASAYTFTGTNSFLIGDSALAVVDPGPDRDDHLKALLAAIDGRPVAAILLTHTHKDHSALARRIAKQTGAPIWFGGKHRLSRRRRPFEINPLSRSCDWSLKPDRKLSDGEILSFGSVKVQAVTTPGHCANHLAFGVLGTPYILTGDHVMGWNSTLVAVPDGSMADYFASLDKLIGLDWTHYLPAHGGPIADGTAFARKLKEHRESRNRQIREAVAGGAHSVQELLGLIYQNLPPANLFAAGMTLVAHLEYLEEQGIVSSRPSFRGRRYFIAR